MSGLPYRSQERFQPSILQPSPEFSEGCILLWLSRMGLIDMTMIRQGFSTGSDAQKSSHFFKRNITHSLPDFYLADLFRFRHHSIHEAGRSFASMDIYRVGRQQDRLPKPRHQRWKSHLPSIGRGLPGAKNTGN